MTHNIGGNAMFALRSRILGPRHLAWLLSLALLLPLAQGVAAAHAVSHADVGSERDGIVRLEVVFSDHAKLLEYIDTLNAGEPVPVWTLLSAQVQAAGASSATIVGRWKER